MSKILFFVAVASFLSSASADRYLKRSEDSEISICSEFDICNLVHNPHWGINTVEKLCKCPEETFCPATFSNDDGKSLQVNVRTQMKFCSHVNDIHAGLKPCKDGGDTAIEVRTIYHIDQVKNISAKLLCSCEHKQKPIYWKYQSRVGKTVTEDEDLFEIVDNFECIELRKCNANEFCGFARLDYGFLFQRCSCDTIHDCLYYPEETEVEEDVESELFYSGHMYKSRCIKNETIEFW
ncbi:CLUMA_CG015422, isoform A [Clunio marinus]|uniref:CLUMA_CG015422, isoform A n=1 Tax=Clunio marinus TaxID=568069 RepID=A0A1J1IP02_9DIPT|nr:CLUMA_CG015422, isoform A [Clunio marinus]